MMAKKPVKPHIIKTEIGDGICTVVPYGISVDVSDAARRLSVRLGRLRRERHLARGAARNGHSHSR